MTTQLSFEYVVMHHSHPDEPHRRPQRISDNDGYFDLSSDEQLEWCRNWIADAEKNGFPPGMFHIARRSVSPWEPFVPISNPFTQA